MKLLLSFGIVGTVLLSGCSFIDPLKGAAAIKLKQLDEVAHCHKLAETHVQTLHKLGFLYRNQADIEKELESLARNDAVRFKGNVIVPLDEIKQGANDYAIYLCPPNDLI